MFQQLEYAKPAKKVCAWNVPLIWDTELHARIIEKKWKYLTPQVEFLHKCLCSYFLLDLS